MKKSFFWIFSLVLLATTITITSCEDDDPCKDVSCGDHGTCFDGVCICDVGYEQDANGECTIEQRAKFVGNWRTDESCTDVIDMQVYDVSYTIIIDGTAGDIERVDVQGFGNSGIDVVTAKINGSTLTFDEGQTFIDADNVEFLLIDATGTIDGNTITFDYNIGNPANGNVEFNCTATATRL